MKIYKTTFLFSLCFGFAVNAYAITPSFYLSNVNSISGQVNVYGDANVPVTLYHGTASVISSVVLGNTDANGSFSTPVSVSGYDISCGKTAYVSVNNQQSQTIPWVANSGNCYTNSSNSVPFSKNNLTLNVGQTESITIYGTGGYYVSGNTSPNSVSVSFSDSQMNIKALSFGVAKITVCENDGACGDVNVTAISTNFQQSADNSQKPVISSLNIFSNNANNAFVGSGNVLTVGFNTNKPVKDVNVAIGYARPTVLGSGSGTYMISYTVGNNEQGTIPVSISFNDFYGNSGQYSFSLNNVVSAPVAVAPIINTASVVQAVSQTPTQTPVITPTKYIFSSFLGLNSKGAEVTELQKRLTSLGFYSGPVNGNFGPLTESAVKKFQKAHNITQAGYVGPSTRVLLNK